MNTLEVAYGESVKSEINQSTNQINESPNHPIAPSIAQPTNSITGSINRLQSTNNYSITSFSQPITKSFNEHITRTLEHPNTRSTHSNPQTLNTYANQSTNESITPISQMKNQPTYQSINQSTVSPTAHSPNQTLYALKHSNTQYISKSINQQNRLLKSVKYTMNH